jgi:hypothetical protein
MPTKNPELKLAEAFVESTGSHVFLTGRAGTGKTTFLQGLKKRSVKRMVVTAPTGVAAINAGGVTLHSFFQLPFGPFIPGSAPLETGQRRFFRFGKEKKRIIRSLDMLVIDEISMVRADLLDAVDDVLRRIRRDDRPFGGVQLLMIGDLFQLPPVAKADEWRLLKTRYDSVYFFSSHAVRPSELVVVELKHIYRQSDAGFIRVLNRVRENRLDGAAVAALNRRYQEDVSRQADGGWITLTTHNKNADAINRSRLASLPGREFRFAAHVEGDFPEHNYPAPAELVLKKGAQVMFLKNDPSPEKRYFNGKIGTVQGVTADGVRIVCDGEKNPIGVEALAWENIRYAMDPDDERIREEITGSFKQIPLKPAWAITIHKSQGLTFDRAIIDAGAAFAHGQVYVALSRCRTLDGMVLSAPLPAGGIDIDPAVRDFSDWVQRNPATEDRLNAARIRYQQQLLLACFDFRPLRRQLDDFLRMAAGNAGRVRVTGLPDPDGLRRAAEKDVFSVGEKFRRQLRSIFHAETLPESDAHILERIGKASAWFLDRFSTLFHWIEQPGVVETDSKELKKRLGTARQRLLEGIVVKRAGMVAIENGFSPVLYLRAVSKAQTAGATEKESAAPMPEYQESDITHPELFEDLKRWRAETAEKNGLARYRIIHQRVLIQIAVHLPASRVALKEINGVGAKTLEKYGDAILRRVIAYRERKGIKKAVIPLAGGTAGKAGAPKTPRDAADTKRVSLDLFREGMDVESIAAERGLAVSTIQGHLCHYVEKGALDVRTILPPEKRSAIGAALAADGTGSLKALKTSLGPGYTYGDIKLMLAHHRHRDGPKDAGDGADG